jgi:hypothetical protein
MVAGHLCFRQIEVVDISFIFSFFFVSFGLACAQASAVVPCGCFINIA